MKTNTFYSATVLSILLGSSMCVQAALQVDYGDFDANTVTYVGVSEANTAPYGEYGAPTVTGDTLSFNPLNMKAESTGAGFEQNDYQLQFEIQADAGKYVQGLDFAEAGDISMHGTGTDATGVDVSASFFVTIYEVDGVELTSTITKTFGFNSMDFTKGDPAVANPGGTVLYVSDLGGSGSFFTPAQEVWNGSIYIDLNDILDENFTSYVDGVTRVSFNIDNVLTAGTEAGTSAFITKKQAGGFSVTSDVVPEPASAVLLVGTASLLGVIRRRFII
jgi:hypothetical protein